MTQPKSDDTVSERTAPVELTATEAQTVIMAMAGNFRPASRTTVLRKLAKAHNELKAPPKSEPSMFAAVSGMHQLADATTEIENLRHALIWALTFITKRHDMKPFGNDDETYEDYSGATRVAWPDNPENWA